MGNEIGILAAFTAGLLSFLSPCVLPLIPAYISYISGISIEELKNSDSLSKTAKSRILFNSFLFVLGFSVVFILLGATATAVGSFLRDHTRLIMKIAGVVIFIFGLHTAGFIRIPFLYYEKRFEMRTKAVTFFSVFLMGSAFAFGWTPCIGPLLAGILGIAGVQDTLWKGVFLLAVYSFGLGLPFILTALAVNRFFAALIRIKKYFHLIEIISGVLLMAIGILFFFGSLGLVSGWFGRMFPDLSSWFDQLYLDKLKK